VSCKNYTKIVFKLYFFKEKRLVILFLFLVQSFYLFSQEGKQVIDTSLVRQDTVRVDTVQIKLRKTSSSGIDSKITYKASLLIKNDIINKQFILVKDADITYGDLEIKADSIVINMKTNILYAIGRKDTTGKVNGKPNFKQGTNIFDSDELTYNFKTRKAIVKNIVTKQDAGLLHSQFTKLLEDGTSNINRSTYSTCDADTPHFYINLPKARVYPGKKIVSGPGNLVLEGIPLPLVIPFGFFPIQTKAAASGIIIPRYGEERIRGFSLTDGGYYFAISNYFDLQVKGSIYSNGSWVVTGQTDYKRLYKYSGSLAFSFADNISGHRGLQDFNESKNYRFTWTYAQDAKASPGSRFNASVNMSSSGYDKNNSYNVQDHITTQRQSSISYSKSWDGTPFNFAISANHTQDNRTQSVLLNLPKASFSMGRIFPFKGKNSSGSTKWYQEIQLSYTAEMNNQISTKDSLLFTSAVWKHMVNGFKHDVPLSLQIRPFKNFSISPALTYSGVLYTQKIERNYHEKYFDPVTNTTHRAVVNDTLRGFFYGQAVNPSISASFSPQIFGTYDFREKSPNSRLQQIRHVIKPSVSFSFVPSFSGLSSRNMYRQIQVDTTYQQLVNRPEYQTYSIYNGNLYGTPSAASKSGNVSFSIVNIVEAKVFQKNDTTGKPKKVKLIDNFGINTAYNIFADKFKWAPVTMNIRTVLFNNISISGNSSFSLYGVDSVGSPVNTFLFLQNRHLMRLTNIGASVDLNVADFFKKDKDKDKNKANPVPAQNIAGQNSMAYQDQLPGSNGGANNKPGTAGAKDAYGYPVFDMPWSLYLSYTMSYVKTGLTSKFTQGIALNNGSITLTKKMSATFNSGYDFTAHEITYTTVGIVRDLHCWTMNLNWVPIGTTKGWNFMIRVKASVLGDLKYERRKDFHDSY
jgi:hypothetical protein